MLQPTALSPTVLNADEIDLQYRVRAFLDERLVPGRYDLGLGTLRYAKERVQFGKPISAFQAVQQHPVTVAQAAEAAHMAVSLAARSTAQRSSRWTFDVAAAKLVANESARTGARAAHQVHGAIGMTREYPLHHFTRRLHLWRLRFGTERRLSDALGTVVAGSMGPSPMPILADADAELVVPWPT